MAWFIHLPSTMQARSRTLHASFTLNLAQVQKWERPSSAVHLRPPDHGEPTRLVETHRLRVLIIDINGQLALEAASMLEQHPPAPTPAVLRSEKQRLHL